MSRTCWVPIVGVVVFAVCAAGITGCCNRCPQQTVAYTIVTPCHIVDVNGCDVTKIRVPRRTPIEWTNQTPDQVMIEFSEGVMKEGKTAVIQPGQSATTTTTGTGFSGPGYVVRLRCGEIEPPSPPIEECPPPPAKCP